jgi:pimeloyl-ACP methyl ester carboxylesterase
MKISYYSQGLLSSSNLIIDANTGFTEKNIVVFFSGYGKKSHWNQSEFGKDLGILRQLTQSACLTIDLDESDYLQSIPDIANQFLSVFNTYKRSNQAKIIILGHSYGGLIAIELAQHVKSIHAIILLDPVLQDHIYLQNLKDDANNPHSANKIKNWDLFPGVKVPASIITRIHLSNGPRIKDKLDYFLPMCKANTWSTLEVHACSHMIHYDLPHRVVDCIKQLLKIK